MLYTVWKEKGQAFALAGSRTYNELPGRVDPAVESLIVATIALEEKCRPVEAMFEGVYWISQ